jgi:hypothetical protein
MHNTELQGTRYSGLHSLPLIPELGRWANKMKHIPKILLAAILITGTGCTKAVNKKAFMDTEFGMSPNTVIHLMSDRGIELYSYEEYRSEEPKPMIKHFGYLVYSDDRKDNENSLYMGSIEMFESEVQAEFNFRNNKLSSVSIHFSKGPKINSKILVSKLKDKLSDEYGLSHREESKGVDGAYTLHFKGQKVSRRLWVNLSDPQNTHIILVVVDHRSLNNREQAVTQREKYAF